MRLGLLVAAKYCQRVAPDLNEVDWLVDRAVGALGELDIFSCAADAWLVKRGINGIGQDLVYAPSRHHVTAEK
jgi:hypothetical protein